MSDPIFNPFGDDEEIIIKDKDGKIRVLNGPNKGFSAKDGARTAVAVDTADEKKSASFDIQKIAIDVLAESKINIFDEVAKKRLLTIIVSFLKGIRDKIDTREVLVRSSKIGGVDLTQSDAERVISLAEKRNNDSAFIGPKIIRDIPYITKNLISQNKNESHMIDFPEYTIKPHHLQDEAKSAISKPQDKPTQVKPASQPLQNDKNTEQEKKDILRLIQDLPELSVLPGIKQKNTEPIQQKAKIPIDTNLEKEIGGILNEKDEISKNPTIVPPKSQAADSIQKAQKPELAHEPLPEKVVFMTKEKPKLLGPIDELREMDIIEFRRLDPNPIKACDKVYEKLQTLEKDSFADKAKGIAAWRQSPVMRLYLEIGKASIVQKEAVTSIVEKRKASGRPYITLDEFQTIMDFNEKIRF